MLFEPPAVSSVSESRSPCGSYVPVTANSWTGLPSFRTLVPYPVLKQRIAPRPLVPLSPPDFRLRWFSTDEVPAGVRLRTWSELMAERLLELKIEPYGNKPFAAHVMMGAS